VLGIFEVRQNPVVRVFSAQSVRFKWDAGPPSHLQMDWQSVVPSRSRAAVFFVPPLQVKGLVNGLSSVGSRLWSIHCRRIWFVVAVIAEGGDPAQQVVKNIAQ